MVCLEEKVDDSRKQIIQVWRKIGTIRVVNYKAMEKDVKIKCRNFLQTILTTGL